MLPTTFIVVFLAYTAALLIACCVLVPWSIRVFRSGEFAVGELHAVGSAARATAVVMCLSVTAVFAYVVFTFPVATVIRLVGS